jgi:hypothetical protein
MNITLPEGLVPWVERQAVRAGFASAQEYVADLLRRECARQQAGEAEQVLREAMAEDGEDPASIPPERVDRRKQEIEAKLLEALEGGPATPMTREDWDELKRRVWERHAGRQDGDT